MKTLDEVEPRIPISGSTTITSPGSYYLTTNIVTSGSTAGITIDADNVTVDLNGFSILGGGANGNGIFIGKNIENAEIRNGTIRDCYDHGIYATSAINCIFKNLRILDNARSGGSAYGGIYAGTGARVEGCRVIGNHAVGIVAKDNSVVVGNTIENQGNDGLRVFGSGSYIADNIVKGNGDNYDFDDGNQLNILLCEVPETLDWPCSVKFAGTLTCTSNGVNGISVNADNVSIDLCGHALIGPGTESRHGISQENMYRNLSVKNGKVVNWKNPSIGASGIYATGKGVRVEGIQASSNSYGIAVANGMVESAAIVSGCTAYDNDEIGIAVGWGSTISGCTAYHNGSVGINANSQSTVFNCSASYNGSDGFSGASDVSISACVATYNAGDGIYLGNGCTVSACTADHNTGDGIQVFSDCRVVGSTCHWNGNGGDGAGIHATSSDNRIDGNNVTNNDRGIDVDASGNFIARNSASGNTTNWTVVAGNVCLVVKGTTGGAISGDSGGTSPGSTDPNANFTY